MGLKNGERKMKAPDLATSKPYVVRKIYVNLQR